MREEERIGIKDESKIKREKGRIGRRFEGKKVWKK